MSSLGENPPAGVGWGVMTTLARRQLSPSLLPAQKSKLHGAFALALHARRGIRLRGRNRRRRLRETVGVGGGRGLAEAGAYALQEREGEKVPPHRFFSASR